VSYKRVQQQCHADKAAISFHSAPLGQSMANINDGCARATASYNKGCRRGSGSGGLGVRGASIWWWRRWRALSPLG
jgi:hypothetical protein